MTILCSDCPPVGYQTDKTRCSECPRHLDCRDDNTGLDDGPPLPRRYKLVWKPLAAESITIRKSSRRKKTTPKPADVMADIRNRAWATRRAKYGTRGHR